MKLSRSSFASIWLCQCLVLLAVVLPSTITTAQQPPSYSLPILDPNFNTTFRQSVCERQQAFHNRSLELRDALQGLALRPVLFVSNIASELLPPGTKVLPKENPGIVIEVLDALAERGGFTWRDSYGLSNLDTMPPGTSFDAILEWSAEMYDISAALWTNTIDRVNQSISFPRGWYDSSIILVGFKPQNQSELNVWSFLEPFSAGVWCLILATVIFSGFIYWWMERYDEESDEQELDGARPTQNLFYAAIAFTGDNRYEPQTDNARLFVFSMAFFFLLIGSAYTANLASFLVVQNQQVNTVSSVDDAVAQGKVMCALGEASTTIEVKNKFPGARILEVLSQDDVYNKINAGQCDLGLTSLGDWDGAKGNSKINGNCQLTWVGRVFRFYDGGFATLSDSGTLCTSLIRDVLNLHMLEMIEDGSLEELWEREYQLSADVNCDATAEVESDDSDTTQLGVADTGGIFIVHYAMVFIALIMAICKKKKNPLRVLVKDSDKDDLYVLKGKGLETMMPEQPPPTLEQMYQKQDKQLSELTTQMSDLTAQMSEMMQQLQKIQAESNEMRHAVKGEVSSDGVVEEA